MTEILDFDFFSMNLNPVIPVNLNNKCQQKMSNLSLIEQLLNDQLIECLNFENVSRSVQKAESSDFIIRTPEVKKLPKSEEKVKDVRRDYWELLLSDLVKSNRKHSLDKNDNVIPEEEELVVSDVSENGCDDKGEEKDESSEEIKNDDFFNSKLESIAELPETSEFEAENEVVMKLSKKGEESEITCNTENLVEDGKDIKSNETEIFKIKKIQITDFDEGNRIKKELEISERIEYINAVESDGSDDEESKRHGTKETKSIFHPERKALKNWSKVRQSVNQESSSHSVIRVIDSKQQALKNWCVLKTVLSDCYMMPTAK